MTDTPRRRSRRCCTCRAIRSGLICAMLAGSYANSCGSPGCGVTTMTRDQLPGSDGDRLDALLHAADEAAEAAFARQLDPQEFIACARHGLVRAAKPAPRHASASTHARD